MRKKNLTVLFKIIPFLLLRIRSRIWTLKSDPDPVKSSGSATLDPTIIYSSNTVVIKKFKKIIKIDNTVMSIRIRNTGNLRDPNPHPDGDSGSYSRRHIIFKYFHVNFFSLGPIFHTLNPYPHAGRFGSAFNVWGSTLLNDIQNRHATLKATFI